jgi:magnesium-transporting ATPase (P-type)
MNCRPFWYMNFSCLTYGFIIRLAVAVVSEQLNYLTVDTLTAVVVSIKVWSLIINNELYRGIKNMCISESTRWNVILFRIIHGVQTLDLLDFTSKRKRMSLIVRDEEDQNFLPMQRGWQVSLQNLLFMLMVLIADSSRTNNYIFFFKEEHCIWTC